MALAETNPNQAVYEPNTPYTGPLGVETAQIRGQNIIAVHPNADGSLTGVGENGETVHLPVPANAGNIAGPKGSK